ncbi:MAG: S26 family signal peptidase [Planctomycetota bacterium]|nr:S26 family signal peptidase [Planctomycetota bacterium]
MSNSGSGKADHHRGGTLDTIAVLLVSFSLAMVFRGFVLEGFVIPTGSMAPTLLGENIRIRSDQTGFDYPVDAQPILWNAQRTIQSRGKDFDQPIFDPMLSQQLPVRAEKNITLASDARLGDRILVLKYLWPFHAPERYDAVVFKNPTDPVGDAAYYVKRIVGLPNERFCIADGDVFTGPVNGAVTELKVTRKGELAQRGAWESVYNSDFQPVDIEGMEASTKRAWHGAPFTGAGWDMRGERVWSHTGAGSLSWSHTILPLDDWNAYNIYRPGSTRFPMADLRIAAEIAMGEEALDTTLTLRARARVFEFAVNTKQTIVTMRAADGAIISSASGPMPSGSNAKRHVELWHVDQSMRVFINGDETVRLDYEYASPQARLQAAIPDFQIDDYMREPGAQLPSRAEISWTFAGDVSLRRVEVSRDLYYRPARLDAQQQNRLPGIVAVEGLGFGVDILNPPILGPRDHVMFGDNSAASRDSRLWGMPHPLVAHQLDYNEPFRVPTEMLIGRAFSVYFPSLLPLEAGGRKIIPDFGRLRFIR